MKSAICTATIFGRDYPGAGATVGPGAVFAFSQVQTLGWKALLPRTRARSGSGTEFGSVGRRLGHPDGLCWGKRKSAGAAAAGACIRGLWLLAIAWRQRDCAESRSSAT
jgi:hypothetical protein